MAWVEAAQESAKARKKTLVVIEHLPAARVSQSFLLREGVECEVWGLEVEKGLVEGKMREDDFTVFFGSCYDEL